MFTGIVEEMGRLCAIQKGPASARLTVEAHKIIRDVQLGDSIACNGVCLTVTDFTHDRFTADVMHETLDRTSLGQLSPGQALNLERAMPMNGRFGGHIVTGHIDGTGEISSIEEDDIARRLQIRCEKRLMRYMIRQGAVALDGTSLTIASISEGAFVVSLIPHTLAATVLQYRKKGEWVNIECDLVGKYVDHLLFLGPEEQEEQQTSSPITRAFLTEHGF